MSTTTNTTKKKIDGGVLFVRILIAVIAIVALGITMTTKSGHTIDKDYLGDRFTWSLGDITGVIVFAIGIIWLMGLGDWLAGLFKKDAEVVPYGSKGQEGLNYLITLGLLVGGLLLIYFL